MLSVYWAKLCFDAGNAVGAPIKELELNMSNEFDLLQSAIYLFTFRNHFVSKFVYSWVMMANLKYGHFLDLHGSLKKISLYSQVIHYETPYWTACFTFFNSSSLAPKTKTWKLNEYLAIGLSNHIYTNLQTFYIYC